MTNHALIRLDGVGKVFLAEEVETHALSNINLSIRSGEYVSIAGPSGCGKTTLLSILGLLDSPTSGRYLLDGTSAENLDAGLRARVRNQAIGFIFQAFNLIGDLTVYENVELPLTYRGTGAAERKERVQESLERVGLAHRTRHYPNQLSGGQQQRVAVARAIVGKPLILLADEPTGNLDSRNGKRSDGAAQGVAQRWRHDLHGDARSAVFAQALPGPEVFALSETVAETMARERFGTILVSLFGALALILTAVGVYSVVAQTVRNRHREIGIRMAVGANGNQVLRSVVMRGLLPIAIGIGIGLVGAAALSGLLEVYLWGVTGTDHRRRSA